MTRSDLRWHTIILIAICWADDPLQSWAQSSPQRPRCSVTTEQDLHEEVRYLQEETIGLVDRHDQLMARSPSSNDIPTDDNAHDSSRKNLPVGLRQGNSVRMVPLSVRGFTLNQQEGR
ncbi:MAG: hypothetical protein KF747_14690 [Nitrospira sp.]|nr:hypothetical protein [Nitrospira sp.]